MSLRAVVARCTIVSAGLLLAAPAVCAQGQEPQPEPTPVETSDPASAGEAQPADDAPPPLETIPVEAEAAPPAADGPAVLDDLIVTATKRAVSVREIPASVHAFDGDALERLGAQSVDDIVRLVPGVTLNDEGGWGPKRVSVRGITSELQTVFATGILFNDVPFNDLFYPFVHLDPNPFDLATVEILKGPHGTLFGGYGLNGLIRYVPEPPKFATTEVKYFAQYTELAQGGAEPAYGAAVNVPLADDALALRLMGFGRKAPGYVDDTQAGLADVNTLDQTGYRGMLAWEPGDWTVSVMHLGQDTQTADVAWTDNFRGELERGHAPRPMPTDSAYEMSSIGVGYSFEWAQLVSQTSRFTKEFGNFLDFSRIAGGGQEPVLGNATYISSEAFIQELRLVSAEDQGSRWQWLIGAFGSPVELYVCVDSQAEAPPLPVAAPAPCPENAGQGTPDPFIAGQVLARVETTDLALFGEVTRELTDRWDVTGGARYYRTSLQGRVITAGAVFEDGMPGPNVVNADFEESGVNPRLSTKFRFTPDLLTYLTVSRGFRFGGVQLVGAVPGNDLPDTYESDLLWNYELGARSTWFGGTLQADAAAYYIDWDRPQLLQRTPDGLFTYTDNVGGAQGQGAEAAVKYRVPFLNGLTLDLVAAYNETVTTVPFTASNGAAIAPGSPWPYAPEWQTVGSAAYALTLGSWITTASLRHTYVSEAWSAIERTAQVYGYETLDFSLGVSSLAWRWLPEINASLNNLTDERAIVGVTVVQGTPAVTYLGPRALIVRIGGTF
jgi:iron complex outermembrane recepter protein